MCTYVVLLFFLPSSCPFLPPSLGKTYRLFPLLVFRVNPKKIKFIANRDKNAYQESFLIPAVKFYVVYRGVSCKPKP